MRTAVRLSERVEWGMGAELPVPRSVLSDWLLGRWNEGVRAMDVNATLAEIRKVVAQLNNHIEGRVLMDESTFQDSVTYVADLWDSLDQWMSNGGFLPRPWSFNRKAAN